MVLALGFGAGCGDDDDGGPSIDVAASCGRIADASCQKMVQCKAVIAGQAVTPALCAQIRPAQVENCAADNTQTKATQADVDACVAGFQAFACTDLCGKVPVDPPACQKLSSEPNEDVVTCNP